MYYKFKKTDLNKLFKIEDIHLNVNKLIIKKYVNEANVFKKDSDDLKTEQEKKIAYLIINHDEIFLNFSDENTVENNLHLMAALMTDASEVIIKIPDSSLQEIFQRKYTIENINFRETNDLSINEDFLMGLTKDGWDNKDFIIKKLNSFKEEYGSDDSNKQLAVELISYIPEEQWLDEDFIDTFLKNKNINKIIEFALDKEKNKTWNILYNEVILDKVVSSQNKNLFNQYMKVYSELESSSSYGNSSITKDSNKNASKILIEKEKNFMPTIGKYFKEINNAKKILKLVSEDYLTLFDFELRKHKEFKEEYLTLVLENLEKKVKGSFTSIWNFTNLVGVDAFSDKRIQEFAIKNGHHIYGKDHEPLLASEIIKHEPEEIAKIIEKGTGIDFLWEYLSPEQKQEKVIAKEMIKQNPKIYNKLTESLRLEKDVFRVYYHELEQNKLLKNFKIGKINKEFFESFNEEDLIDLITVVPEFLFEEKFPGFYFDNMNVMVHSCVNYQYFYKLYHENDRAKKTLDKIFENKELSMLMLEKQHNIFEYLSENLKSDMEILEKYVTHSYNYENLPPKVFLNKNLLLHIVRGKPNFVEKVPKEFFKDQDFLLRIFEKIDKKELSEKILTSLPTVINEILNTTPLEVGNYYQFFSKTFANMNLTEKLEPGKNLKIKKAKI